MLRVDLPAHMLPPKPEEAPVLTKADSRMPPKQGSTMKQQSVKGQPSTLRQASTMGNGQLDRFGSIVGEDSEQPTLDSLITTRHLTALRLECIYFVSELLSLDTKVSSKSRAFVEELTESSETQLSGLVKDLAAELAAEADPDDPFANDTSGQRSPRIALPKRNCWCDPEWVRQFCRANIALVALLVHQRRSLMSAKAGLVCFQKVLLGGISAAQKETGSEAPYRVLFTIKTAWVAVNYLLAEVAERQGRFQDTLRLATRGAEEVSGMCWSHWLRYFLFLRGKVLLKLGKLDGCEMDCNTVLGSFDYYTDVLLNGAPKQLYVSHSSGHIDAAVVPTTPIGDRTRVTLLLSRVLVLKASVIRMRSLREPSKAAAQLAVRHCIKLTKAAVSIAKSLAAAVGFLGSDSNISFRTQREAGNKGMISEHHLLPPLLHSLTEIHPNDPLLSIDPVPPARTASHSVTKTMSTTIVHNINSQPTQAAAEEDTLFNDTMRASRGDILSHYSGNVSMGFFHRPELRLGPVDGVGPSGQDVVYTASEFANISLPEVRCLAVCICALGKVVLDAEPLIAEDRERRVLAAKRGSANEGEEEDEEMDPIPLEVLVEVATEEGLKLLRHIVYPSIFLRSSLLLHAGVFRARPRVGIGSGPHMVHATSSTMLSPMKGALTLANLGALQPDPVPGEAKAFDDFSRMGRVCVDPLRKGLEVCVAGNIQPLETMRATCIELVERYGSDRLGWADEDVESDPMTRLSLSAYFLKLAIQLNGCIRALNESPLDMTTDKTFSEPCPADIARVLEAVTSSSVTVGRTAAPIAAAAAPATAAPVKGAKAPAPAASGSGSQLTGRDALFALSALCRETDPLWLDGFEYDFISDLHAGLVAHFPVYKDKCTLKEVPDTSNVELKVEAGSVSSLWVLASNEETRARGAPNGLFDAVTGYFLLGADPKASSTDPLLTRTCLSYTEAAGVEKEAAMLRDHVHLKNLPMDTVAARCQALLIQVYTYLKRDSSDNAISATVQQEGDTWRVQLTESTAGRSGNGRECAFDVSVSALGALTSVFSYRTGASGIGSGSVSSLLWLCLA